MTKIKTLEQDRLQNAWDFINKNDIEKIETPAKKLPAMILTSGLGQTVAFYLSKKETKKIIDNVAQHISRVVGFDDIQCGEELLEKIKNSDSETYILLSEEALKYSTWLKRLVEAKTEE